MGVARMALVAMECKFVTEEYVKEWKATNSPRKLQLSVSPARFIYELCWTVVRGELPSSKCRVALDAVDLTAVPAKEETASILADTTAHMGQELAQPGELRSRLIELAKWLVESALVPVRLLQERCEAEFLWEAEMIKIKASDLKSKEVRVNTRLLYQQTKFNLLREESEGYAKLITLLTQRGPDGLSQKTAPAVISTLKSLIGHFDLDPNRVFDIVLECFELQPENNFFLELIPLFPKSHITHILGFKFQYYQRAEVEDPVPSGLYRLAATLIKAKFIDLDSIYAHLVPKDEEAFQKYEAISKKRMEEANKIGKINLAATGRDLMEEEKPGDVTIDLYAALDMETEPTAERAEDPVTNQKLGLLNGFLSVDDWADAYVLFERLAPLNPVAHPTICGELTRSIEKEIAPFYSQAKQLNSGKASGHSSSNGNLDLKKGPLSMCKDVFQMLSCVGPYLHRDAILLQKVCRVLRVYYTAAVSSVQNLMPSHDNGENERRDARNAFKEARIRVEEVLGSCLLPSLQLLPANPAVGLEIWEVMSLLPYEVRYRLYGEWEKEDEPIPMLVAARQTARLDTRRILKRLAKENLKQLGRMLAKIAHANPMTVLRTIVHQIEAYKDMIAPVVDAFKFLTQLEYDILEYVVIERLVHMGREKIKEDGLNVSDWLQSLASFWGHLCKKYPSMELRGLFQYLVNQLKKGEGTELVVLQELIQQMASVEFTENVTEDQLEALAGGEVLRYQATAFGVTRNNKFLRQALLKSTNRLRDSLLSKEEPKLAVPLVLLIAQHRSIVVVNADSPHIKMVSEQYDRCHGILLQYIDFLTSAVSPVTAYAQLIPTLDDLVHKYHIEPEVAFLIYRPVMCLFKSSKSSSITWPLDTSVELDKKQLGDAKVSSELVLDLGPHKKAITWSELLGTVHSMLPARAWNSLSPELYATFWGLTLPDLYVPQKRYDGEIAKQRAALKALEESPDNSTSAIARRRKEKEKVQDTLDRLKAELTKQEENMASVHARLLQEKDSWLTSCPDSLKINMEFLQRCIFPRCVFSMMDAVYCARFVYKLHSLGTPFFNTVNHIDVLICKTLQPMISCCTEFEAGRLGRFLCETLKMAYYWKSTESVYEEECAKKPGFAVLYRDPNSARVTYSQYIRVHWKWSARLTKLLIQCLESSEYMEIRNALTVLTKISSVFPVMKKSGVNIERRVSKIKGDEREDLKVLAIGVTAALATRKNAWVSDEEFGMGLIDVKPAASPAKVSTTSSLPPTSSPAPGPSPLGAASSMTAVIDGPSLQGHLAPGSLSSGEAPPDSAGREESLLAPLKSEQPRPTLAPSRPPTVVGDKIISAQTSNVAQTGVRVVASGSNRTGADVSSRVGPPPAQGISVKGDEPRQAVKQAPDMEGRTQSRRPSQSNSIASQNSAGRPVKFEVSKEEATLVIPSSRSIAIASAPTSVERDAGSRSLESVRRPSAVSGSSATPNGTAGLLPTPAKTSGASSRSGSERGGVQEMLGRSSRPSGEHVSRNDSLGLKLMEAKGIVDRDRFDLHELGSSQRVHALSKSPARREETSRVAEDPGKDRAVKRTNVVEEADRLSKRRKGGGEVGEKGESGEMRSSDRDRGAEQRLGEGPRAVERDRLGYDDRLFDRPRDERPRERSLERVRDRVLERGERDYRGLERSLDKVDRERVDDYVDRLRDRSTERFTADRSGDRSSERSADRGFDRVGERMRDDRVKDERARARLVSDQPLINDRYTPTYSVASSAVLPPAPSSILPHMVPLSLAGSRTEDDVDRRMRSVQRVSPSREDKMDKRRQDEGSAMGMDESKRRREEEIRDRKREERDIALKVEKEREKEKAMLLKEEAEGMSKRRRLKRGDIAAGEVATSFGPPPISSSAPMPQGYDSRERERKGVALPRNVYVEEGGYEKGRGRAHGKESVKLGRREQDMLDREWEEDSRRQRGDMKRRHHRK